MYTVEQIEDAIISELSSISGIRVVKTYQGELESEDVMGKVIMYLPAIYVVYGGSVYEYHGERKVETMSFFLVVCDKNLRKESEARRGGSGNPGTYAMLDSIRDKLYGKQLSLDIFPFELERQAPVWFAKGLSVYSAEYTTAQQHLYPNG